MVGVIVVMGLAIAMALWSVAVGAALWALVYAWRVGIARARVSRLVLAVFPWPLASAVTGAVVGLQFLSR